ncbi:MAG TPA: SPOR domain-containing protein [Aliidongia sp.]|nr:SPOR domain-containing protein [Aliidongia sp.]
MGPRLYPDEHEPSHEHEFEHQYADEQDENLYYEEEPERPRFAFLRPVLLGVVAIGCAGALWYAYSKTTGGGNGGAIPLIRADQSATKVKPDSPGGETVPDQDKLVYNPNQPGAKVERLLAPPEQPLPRAVAPPPTDINAPLPVQEVGQAPVPKSIPSAPGAAASPPPPPAGSSGMLSAPEGAKSVAGIEIPPAPPTPAAPGKPGAAPAASGGVFKVQIAATRDEATAQSEWERLKHAHADLLGSLSPTVVRADLGDKGIFYRIQAGPVPDQAKAEKLCTELKKLSIGCIIVKP